MTVVAGLAWLARMQGTFSVSAAQVAVDDGLPAGQGKETVLRVCGDCHGVDLVSAQYRRRGEWTNLVEDMASRGGNATQDDIKAIVDYGFTHFGLLNINNAAEADLTKVLQLTPEEAKAVVEYRTKQGEFKTIDDVKKVPGLDAAKVDQEKDHIVFTGA